jgi:hypothetical protein
LQSHFVELNSGFKNGIKGLSLLVGAPEFLENYDDVDDIVIDYTLSFLDFLCTNEKILRSGGVLKLCNFYFSCICLMYRIMVLVCRVQHSERPRGRIINQNLKQTKRNVNQN